jgi:hypothetical protein
MKSAKHITNVLRRYKMQFGRVDVNSLVNVQNTFTRSEIDKVADALIAVGTAIKPIIVTKGKWKEDLGNFEYEVLENHLVALAVQQAKLLEPKHWEMVDAYIVEKGDSLTAISTLMSM